VDQELKQYLDGKFAGIDVKLAGVEAKLAGVDTKLAGVEAKFAGIEARFAGIEARFASKLDLERVETALLTEFHKWASPAEARARTHTATLRAIDLEMEVLTERVQKLEKRDIRRPNE
jgi:hypothetical protein